MKFPLLLSIAFLLLILFSLESQEKWRKLTTADGLSSNVVNQIYQTENGDIWIGTKRGIDRYNGVFQPFFYQTNSGVELESDIFEMTTGQTIIKLIINKTNHPRSVTTEISLFDGLEWEDADFFSDNNIPIGESRLQSFYLYLQNNLDSIVDYHRYRKKGCYISSGLVEKTIDLLVCRRLKLRGQNWSRPGADNLLLFRQMMLNDQWPDYWSGRKIA